MASDSFDNQISSSDTIVELSDDDAVLLHDDHPTPPAPPPDRLLVALSVPPAPRLPSNVFWSGLPCGRPQASWPPPALQGVCKQLTYDSQDLLREMLLPDGPYQTSGGLLDGTRASLLVSELCALLLNAQVDIDSLRTALDVATDLRSNPL